jgi:branched-chain amino acid transport system permease protein
MTTFFQYVVAAISLGGLYALASLGVALIFGVMSLINFAHGAFIMIGAYVVIGLSGAGAVVAIVGAVAAVVLLALATERIAFRGVRNASGTTMLATSFAVAFFLESAIVMTVGADPLATNFLSSLSEPLSIGGVRVPWVDVITIALSAGLLAAVAAFLRRTRLGVEVRAASEDFSMARLLGVKANRVIAIAFAISGVLAATVSILYLAKNGSATPGLGLQLVLIAFVATVIGGLGSMAGAALAGFGIGCVTVLLDAVLSVSLQDYTEALVFVVVILVLLVRPQGLFGVYNSAARV